MNTTTPSTHVIRNETVPVRIDITDAGFPTGIPALRWHERALEVNPWIRRRFGHYALIDPWGRALLGVSYRDVEGPLADRIAQFRSTSLALNQAQAMQTDCSAAAPPAALRPVFDSGPLSTRWMTAYELSFDHWAEVLTLLDDTERLAPGVRNAAIHALADLVLNPPTETWRSLRTIGHSLRREAGHAPRDTPPMAPGHLRDRAAAAVAHLVNLSVTIEDADLVDRVEEWWNEHRHDPDLTARWSKDPQLRYSFLRPDRDATSGGEAPSARCEDREAFGPSASMPHAGRRLIGRRPPPDGTASAAPMARRRTTRTP